jgi:Tol biopolymer transport system component
MTRRIKTSLEIALEKMPKLKAETRRVVAGDDADVALESFLSLLQPELSPPRIAVEPRVVRLCLEMGEKREVAIRIKNTGRGVLFGTIELSSRVAGVRLSQNRFMLNSKVQTEENVVLNIDTSHMTAGETHRVTLEVTSNAAEGKISIPLSVQAEERKRRMKEAAGSSLRLGALLSVPYVVFSGDRLSTLFGIQSPLTELEAVGIVMIAGVGLGLPLAVAVSGSRPRWYGWGYLLLSWMLVVYGLILGQMKGFTFVAPFIASFSAAAVVPVVTSAVLVRLAAYFSVSRSRLFAFLIPLVFFAGSGYGLETVSRLDYIFPAADEGKLYVFDLNGGSPVDIGPGHRPFWSPDGEKLAFFRKSEDGGSYLFVSRIDEGEKVRISPGASWVQWSPDGQKLAYVEFPRHVLDSSKIVVKTGEGKKVARVLHPSDVDPDTGRWMNRYLLSFAQWSPEGDKIVFYCQGRYNQWYHFAVNADGSNPTRLTQEAASAPFRILPEGAGIAYLDFDRYLFAVDLEGSDRVRLSEKTVNSFDWSPEGLKIAYVTADYELYVVDVAEKSQVRIAAGVYAFQWSPDGNRLAYTVAAENGDRYRLYAAGAGGRGRVRLAEVREFLWSPDGQLIAYHDGEKSYIVPASGGSSTELADIVAAGGRVPARQEFYWWSPTGEHLAFLAREGRTYTLYVLDTDGGETAKVAGHVRFAAWSPDGARIAVDVVDNGS